LCEIFNGHTVKIISLKNVVISVNMNYCTVTIENPRAITL